MHYKIKKRGAQAGWVLKAWETGKERYVPQERWPAGLRGEMTLDEARAYIKTLNASKRIPTDEARRLRAAERHANRVAINHALLPEQAVLQFERNNILFMKDNDPTRINREIAWSNAQKIIIELGMHPSDWALSPDPIYAALAARGWSWDYCRRIVSMMNRYGHLYCRLFDKAFMPLRLDDQKKKVAIEVAFGDGEESEPFQIGALSLLDGKIPEEKFNWLWISFWFMLRPHEVDMLHLEVWKDRMPVWWVEDNGTTLVVYQPKLNKVKPNRRYKRIPIKYSEQVYALELIRSGKFKRLSQRQTNKWLPTDVSLYGCRHGGACFFDGLGIDVYAVSRWLGHQSVTTTERYYLRLGLRRDSAA